MATRKKKKVVVIDVDTPLKKNELSLDFMMAYIEKKVEADKIEEAKASFKKEALDEDGGYVPKKARDYFATAYPEAVKKPEKKSARKAEDKLADW